MYEAVRADLVATLLRAAAADGGWGYYAGKEPRVEPTLWALLALSREPGLPVPFVQFASPHLGFLAQAQRPDGLLVDAAAMPPNFASNGLAACVLPVVAPERVALTRGVLEALALVKGLKVDSEPGAAQDNTLQAWPWYPDTFSWVEPTAWCLLALKKAPASMRPASSDARVKEAEAVLRDRQCSAGGWNYGNASVLGQDLRPYVPTSALGVLALQDKRASDPVARAVAYLEVARSSEPSAMALSLTATALHLCDRPYADVVQRLAEGVEHAVARGNLHYLAMALYALGLDVHDGSAFRV